ncbi:GNAT family N-acetyltransferase [Gramella jeungdoensis]|uniref:GNAT family N-acetyltransferase n=1 Tax=Gramella jeungdoensis TaxID=708091 RepID=A0ABT0Z5V0_9FLAO|nr:GNAT family N-acetyltransferase [Gramella jeungdoensis]MCM8571114.1 GNAT family N-acetyltransferase [Gramella jeungdoensis]
MTENNLNTPRLIIKKIQRADHENIFKGLSHPEVIKFYGVHFDSFEETEEQMNWYENLEKSGSGKWWSIWLRNSEEFCGAIGLNDFHEEHNKAELGFWLLPNHWGNGFIQEAGEKVINYLFKDFKLHRIEAFVESENKNSSKVLKKLGFEYEGCMKESEIKNGKYINVEFYAKINPAR